MCRCFLRRFQDQEYPAEHPVKTIELGTFAKHHCHNPTGSKSETDAFILPLCKDDPRPLSEGASKEDFAAQEPPDDDIELESPLPDGLADLPAAGSEMALLSQPLSSPSRVCRHDEVSPDDAPTP